METTTITLPEKPIDQEVVYCPHCGYNITTSFNSYRTAIFSSEQKEYLARKKRLEKGIPGWVKEQIQLHVSNYEKGELTSPFDFRCKNSDCNKKLKFTAHHTLKGATTMADGRPILIVHPNPKAVEND